MVIPDFPVGCCEYNGREADERVRVWRPGTKLVMARVREDGGLDHRSNNSNAISSRKPTLNFLLCLQQKVHVCETLTDLTAMAWVLLCLFVNLSFPPSQHQCRPRLLQQPLQLVSDLSLSCYSIPYIASKVVFLNADPMCCTSAYQNFNAPNYLTNGLNHIVCLPM